MRKKNRLSVASLLVWLLCGLAFVQCSTTRNLPEGEVLYTGIRKIQINNKDKSPKGGSTLDEVEAAISVAPNNSFMGSASIRTPFPVGLWLYNGFANAKSGIGKWIFDKLAPTPVLISTVNPATRSKVGTNLLRDYGYFNGKVTYEIVDTKNPKKQKISYTIDMGKPYRIDSVIYEGFAQPVQELIEQHYDARLVHKGDQFDVTVLQRERERLMYLMRDNGFHYFRNEYITFLADTLLRPGAVCLKVTPRPNIPEEANKRYYIGNTFLSLTGFNGETPTDSMRQEDMTLYYYGDKPAVKMSVLRDRIIHKPGEIFSLKRLEYSQEGLTRLGIFKYNEFNYVPRDTTKANCWLDVWINSALDLPYDAQLELNVANKSTRQLGPGAIFTLSRKNFMRMGASLNLELKGSYEWQTQETTLGEKSKLNSYEMGASLSLNFPRLVLPWDGDKGNQYKFFSETNFKIYTNLLNRGRYFRMLSFGGQAQYSFRRRWSWRHTITPFQLTYNTLLSHTAVFDSVATANPLLFQSLDNQFIPAMKYTLTYDDAYKKKRKNSLWWESSITSAGNVTSLAYAIAGRGFKETNKQLLGTPFSQFLKLTSELRWLHTFDRKNQLAMRLMGGVIWAYGNRSVAPYSEQFYVGGANSIRAFTFKSIGPGRFLPDPTDAYAFMDATGDLKLEANIEYRFRILSNLFGGTLNGATFIDAGNVWLLRNDDARSGAQFSYGNFFKDIALGTGFGLRYDLSFLVLRLDLGAALHLPYATYKSGYYNVPKFRDGLSLHFAIGYPF